jgi:hypothetical protein
MKYKIILKTSSRHRERVLNCLNTWLNGADYIFLTDNIQGDIGPEFSGSNRTDYSSNEEKTVTFINDCIYNKKYIDYDWFVFVDDDAILNKKAVEYIIPFLDKNYVYGLRMRGSWPKDTSLDFPSGGSGYFISPQLISSMPIMPIRGHGQEDVSIGEWLRDVNITIKDRFMISNDEYRLWLNGWYPLSQLKKNLDFSASNDCDLIFHIDMNHINFLKKHITHHYIRSKCLMEYIAEIFREWTPDYIEK